MDGNRFAHRLRRSGSMCAVAAIVCLLNSSAFGQWQRGWLGIGVNLAAQYYEGDVKKAGISPAAQMALRVSPFPYFEFRLHSGYGNLANNTSPRIFNTGFMQAEALGSFIIMPNRRISPFVFAGGSNLKYRVKGENGKVLRAANGVPYTGWTLAGFGGVGLDMLLAPHWSVSISGDYHQTLTDHLDAFDYGGNKDGYFTASAGLMFSLGGSRDSDHDGIPDNMDVEPKGAEDLDDFEDGDGAPDIDNDNDGVPDAEDKEPLLAEDRDGFEDGDGVPDPDNDRDGVPDASDSAPDEPEDLDGVEDEDGAPDLDNDGDGLFDRQDGAPNLPEDLDGFQDQDGIPDLDNDGDGIPDARDKAPMQPETVNGYMDDDGAPDGQPWLLSGERKILEGVTFESGQTELSAVSYLVLDKIVQLLNATPEAVIEIHGFTDKSGSTEANLEISRQRAEAVTRYLQMQGIDPRRISAMGYGPAKPVASNSTADGRRRNRRIEVVRTK